MVQPTVVWKFGGTSLAEPLPSACGGRADGRGDGLVVELGRRDDSVVRTLPPLNVTADVVDMACTILIDAIEHCAPKTGRLLSLVPAPVRART